MDLRKFSNSDICTSASGVISLLDEEETSLKMFGLEKLNSIVDVYWPELADYIFKIEELCEDKDFVGTELANLVASKVYFHLEKYTDALKYALCAGKLFNINEKSKYVETLLAKCIEKYVEYREKNLTDATDYSGIFYGNEDVTVETDITQYGNVYGSTTYGTAYAETNTAMKSAFLLSTKNENSSSGGGINTYNNRIGINTNAGTTTTTKGLSVPKNEEDSVDDFWTKEIHKKMELLVDHMLEICIRNKNIKQALGVALDARRLDKAKYIIAHAPNKIELLQHSMNNEKYMNAPKSFRKCFYKLLVDIYLSLPEEELHTEYVNLCECLFYIKDAKKVSEILLQLLEKNHLMAFQLSFDLVDFENRIFLRNILKHLLSVIKKDSKFQIEKKTDGTTEETNGKRTENTVEEKEVQEKPNVSLTEEQKVEPSEENAEIDEVMRVIPTEHPLYDKMKKMIYILSGQVTINTYIEFLHRNNHADLVLLDTYKNVVESRSSITHHGIIIAHALMQTGTTCDVFLRSNIEWLSKAINWAKFSATASLGAVYKGHVKESFNVLSTYLPSGYIPTSTNSRDNTRGGGGVSNITNPGSTNSVAVDGGLTGGSGLNVPTNNTVGNTSSVINSNVYSEGGSLYALGLIHANYRTNEKQVRNYLLEQLRSNPNDEVLQHGCCLGLALVCFGCYDDEDVYEELKSVMYSDSAVAGEGAVYAIGLLKIGSGDERCVEELISYAHDTQHEKITRACGVSIGFVMFQKENEADVLIDELINDKDAIIRYGGMFTIALAYCGLFNSNKNIIKKLLHYSVSDVSDDVRRAAVIALGFVLCNTPHQVPKFLNLLIGSYNPHVRYGAAMALGIACAATANEEAISMLIPLLTDTTDFVRQSAFIALGFIFQQTNEYVNSNLKLFKEEILKILSDKHEDIIAKFGAIVSAGLLDISGRNAISTFFTRRRNMIRAQAAAGFCLFIQLWYWFPLIHMISLTFSPTCLIGVTEDLKIPQNFFILSSCKSPNFDYPAYVSKEKVKEQTETVTAVLSTTAKRKTLKLKKPKNEKPKAESVSTSTAGAVSTATPVERNPQDDTSSVLSDGKSMKNLEVLSTAATVGQSSHVSHSGSVAGSANEEITTEQTNETNIPPLQKGRKEKAKVGVDMKNPCRVIKAQEKFIEYLPNARYKPVLSSRKSGFVVLLDTTPEEPADYIESKLEEDIKKEAPPFEPFTWKEN